MSVIRLASLGFVIVFTLLGCDSPQGDSAAPEDGTSRGTIGVSLMTLTNPFFKVIGDTIAAEARLAGYDVMVVGADEDAAKQSAQVKDFIVSGVAAIVLAPYDSRAIGPAIAEAHAAGIPVFTVDNGCLADGCQVLCHVATDNEMGGRQAGEAMLEALDGRGGPIAILDHKVTESCLLRVKGFKAVVDQHNMAGESPVEIVSELPSGGNRSTGHRAMKDILQAHSDLVGVFAINDPSALGACAALEADGKEQQVIVIGFDGQPEGKKAIRSGRIYADPIQFPDKMARKTMEMILGHFDGALVPAEVLIPTALYRQDDAVNDASLD